MFSHIKTELTTKEYPLLLIASINTKNIDNQDPVEFLKAALQVALGVSINFGEVKYKKDSGLINMALDGTNLPTLQALINRYGEAITRDVWDYIKQTSGLAVMGESAVFAIYGEQPFNELDGIIRSAYLHAVFQGLNHANFGFIG